MTFLFRVFELPMEPDMFIAIVDWLDDFLFVLFVLDIRSREAWVNVLRGLLMLRVLLRFHARDVCFLQRTVLVQGAADEIGAVREVWGSRADLDWARASAALSPRFRHGDAAGQGVNGRGRGTSKH